MARLGVEGCLIAEPRKSRAQLSTARGAIASWSGKFGANAATGSSAKEPASIIRNLSAATMRAMSPSRDARSSHCKNNIQLDLRWRRFPFWTGFVGGQGPVSRR